MTEVPWDRVESEVYSKATGATICMCPDTSDSPAGHTEALANARAIALLPEMVALLRTVRDFSPNDSARRAAEILKKLEAGDD